MAIKKSTRKTVNDPIIDSALRDVYTKLDKLQPSPPGEPYDNLNTPEEGTVTAVDVSGNEADSGTISTAVYTKDGWLVDINSNYQRIGTRGFIAAEGMKGRSKTPVQGEALSYDRNRNIVIGNSQGNKTLIKNEGGIIKFRNQIDTADASIQCSDVRDASGNKNINIYKTPNAVNYLNVKNSITGISTAGPTVTVDGTDDHISLKLEAKGNGFVQAIRATSGDAAENAIGLRVDFDRTVASSGTNAHNDIGIDLDVNSASLGTSSVKGMDIDVVGATSGTHTATGIELNVSGADTNEGLIITNADGGTDIKLVSSANTADYCTISTTANGETTISTVDGVGELAHLTLSADGDIKFEPLNGGIKIREKSAANTDTAGYVQIWVDDATPN